MRTLVPFLLGLLLPGCSGYPVAISPVQPFDIERYLGRWYEIARLDHSFERGLQQVSAEYSLQEGGQIKVVNRGYATEKGRWKEAVGKAHFARATDEGYLKVSFFGPFYSSYVIFELDQDHYQYAFVCGPNDSYLWLLARTPTVRPELLSQFRLFAKERGFNTEKLIYVEQKEL